MISVHDEQLLGRWYSGGFGSAQSAMGPMLKRAETYAGELRKCNKCGGAGHVGGKSRERARRILADRRKLAELVLDEAELAQLDEIERLAQEQSADDESSSKICVACKGSGRSERRNKQNELEGDRVPQSELLEVESPRARLARHAAAFGTSARCTAPGCGGTGCKECGGSGYGFLDTVGYSIATAGEGREQPELMSDADLRDMARVTALLDEVREIDADAVVLSELFFGGHGFKCAGLERGRDVSLYHLTEAAPVLLAGDNPNKLPPEERMYALVLAEQQNPTDRSAFLNAAADEAKLLSWRMHDAFTAASEMLRRDAA